MKRSKFNAAKEARRRAREQAGQPPKTRVIQGKKEAAASQEVGGGIVRHGA